ncbi:hypothetical protein BHM03_00005218 [Ensete ventricosum]|nr:hypothetical protein BHM03_00005218 [Ensete ventricosum]
MGGNSVEKIGDEKSHEHQRVSYPLVDRLAVAAPRRGRHRLAMRKLHESREEEEGAEQRDRPRTHLRSSTWRRGLPSQFQGSQEARTRKEAREKG